MLNNYCIVFDLDDTLYNEIDYIKSGYFYLKKKLESKYNLKINYIPNLDEIKIKSKHIQLFKKNNILKLVSVNELIELIRNHKPNIKISKKIFNFINYLYNNKCKICLITDGRIKTQNNKIKSLGIRDYFDSISISEKIGFEKPHPKAFNNIIKKFPNKKYVYIGDNPKKDFVTPNTLGWLTIGIKNNKNRIHKLNNYIKKKYRPNIWIDEIEELDHKKFNSLLNNFYN